MKQIWLILLGILLFSIVVSADSTWETGDTMLVDRSNIIYSWFTNPCLGNGVETGTNMYVEIRPYTCAIVKANSCAWLTGECIYEEARCDNVSIKIVGSLLNGTTLYETDWKEVRGAKFVDMATLPSPSLYNSVYNRASAVSTLYETLGYTKFGVSYLNIGTFAFAYNVPSSVAFNASDNGYTNYSFNMNKTGDYSFKIYMKDAQNGSIAMATRIFNFSVSDTGAIYGTCNSTNSVGTQPTDNPVTDIFGAWDDIVWFILMLIIGGILLLVSKKDMAIGIGITIFAELLLVIIGTWLHIISPIFILIVGLLIAAFIAIKIRQAFT